MERSDNSDHFPFFKGLKGSSIAEIRLKGLSIVKNTAGKTTTSEVPERQGYSEDTAVKTDI